MNDPFIVRNPIKKPSTIQQREDIQKKLDGKHKFDVALM